jgi:transcriptional regulator with XRE-family HTH domain
MELLPHAVVDPVRLGRLLRAARNAEGYTAQQVAAALKQRYSIELTTASITGYERGLRMPPLDVFVALILVLRPQGGMAFFLRAFRSDAAADWKRLDDH